MKTFSKYINEMGVISGKIDGNFHNREAEWNTRKENLTKLKEENIGSMHLKLYKIYNQYFLVTEENKYIGSIEFNYNKLEKEKICKIKSSFKSKIRLNVSFYKIIFHAILSLDEVKEIHSDTNLSSQALRSYLKLKTVKVKLSNGNKLSKDNYNDDISSYIVVTESEDHSLSIWKDKIFHDDTYLDGNKLWESVYKKAYNSYDKELDYCMYTKGL